MNVQTIMETKIVQAISFEFLNIENESYHHAVPVHSETHFKVILVSDVFEGMALLARHRLVNALLSEELAGPVHALALHTYTVAQWLEKNKLAPDSGKCLGGGK